MIRLAERLEGLAGAGYGNQWAKADADGDGSFRRVHRLGARDWPHRCGTDWLVGGSPSRAPAYLGRGTCEGGLPSSAGHTIRSKEARRVSDLVCSALDCF